jgi:hypothetical protein
MMMCQVIKGERDKWSNIICYHHIALGNIKCVYKAINDGFYVTTYITLPTMEVVT